MRLPTSPMLAKPGPLPTGPGWSYEVKWDGFRALVSTVDGLKVRSRRGWNMTEALPELRGSIKVKNPAYWRRPHELAAVSRTA